MNFISFFSHIKADRLCSNVPTNFNNGEHMLVLFYLSVTKKKPRKGNLSVSVSLAICLVYLISSSSIVPHILSDMRKINDKMSRDDAL